MPLEIEITRAWEATNEAGGALASALHALRTDDVETPITLRRPARKVEANDRLGEALLLVAEAKRAAAIAVRRAEEIEASIQKQLATR
jgi:hypothetical protein